MKKTRAPSGVSVQIGVTGTLPIERPSEGAISAGGLLASAGTVRSAPSKEVKSSVWLLGPAPATAVPLAVPLTDGLLVTL